MRRMSRGWKIAMMVVFGTGALVLFGLFTQWLWNTLVPELFAGPAITFWQAVGLLVLSKILFSGFGRGGGGRWRHRPGPYGYYWGEKWKNMSPEEREQMKQKMWAKWGCYPEQDSAKNTPQADQGVSNG